MPSLAASKSEIDELQDTVSSDDSRILQNTLSSLEANSIFIGVVLLLSVIFSSKFKKCYQKECRYTFNEDWSAYN